MGQSHIQSFTCWTDDGANGREWQEPYHYHYPTHSSFHRPFCPHHRAYENGRVKAMARKRQPGRTQTHTRTAVTVRAAYERLCGVSTSNPFSPLCSFCSRDVLGTRLPRATSLSSTPSAAT